jgi:hypothetical protein
MCSLTIECVLLQCKSVQTVRWVIARMCSLTIECVLLLSNVFSYYRMCSLTIECVLLQCKSVQTVRWVIAADWLLVMTRLRYVPNMSLICP